MKFSPHDYQSYAIDFIKSHDEALLLLDMGLGKTVISLTAAADLKREGAFHKVLIIAPLRVAVTVWPAEKDKWDHTKHLTLSVMTGSAAERLRALHSEADIYVINRENVSWLVQTLENQHTKWPFDFVILDELSSFKNHDSIRFKALRKVRPYIRRMVGLTGTPAPNGLMDLWAEVGLVDKGARLGRFIGQYRNQFFRPFSMNPSTGIVYSYAPLPGAEEEIYRRISDITISMKSVDHLSMPDKFEVNHFVTMTPAESARYDRLKNELILELDGTAIDAANAGALANKLHQLANGAVYTAPPDFDAVDGAPMERPYAVVHDKKLDLLSELLEEANGQNVLICYWFRHDRERILARLRKEGYRPQDLASPQSIADWNAGKIPIALISPASAGHGLNIQSGGHIMIWFSLCWSLELFEQANARLWRQGQKDVVTIHRLLCRDTIDENILSALESKSTTQQNLISAVRAHLPHHESQEVSPC